MATELNNFKATLTMEDFSETAKPPDAEEETKFWKRIWNTSVEHKPDAEWINKTREKMRAKGFGSNRLQSYMKSWLQLYMKRIEVEDVPGCLVKGGTILVMRKSKKGTEVVNYKNIACLNLI